MIRLLADDATLSLLADLPRDQREAVTAGHVIEGEDYPAVAAAAHTSEAAGSRQRVSRGLGTLRRRMGGRA